MMAVSFHIVVPFFLVFGLIDVALLSVRALLSRQRHHLTMLYALMGVQEVMLVFELLTTLGPLFSTYLVTAGMWSHIASVFAVFFPLWVLRILFTAFTMVYKDILIPRWTAAARRDLNAGLIFGTPSIRGWHAAGYGAVMVLDVVCCCAYYLAAIYVLGYFSDKTLYVPYHRRRWRHEQRERAAVAATAAAEARDPSTKAVPSSSSSQERAEKKRKRGRHGEVAESSRDNRHRAGSHSVQSLARTPSFAQWQGRTHLAVSAPVEAHSYPLNNTYPTIGGERASEDDGQRHRKSGLPSFSPVLSTSTVRAGLGERLSGIVLPRPSERPSGPLHASFNAAGDSALHASQGEARVLRAAVYQPPDALQQRSGSGNPVLGPSRGKRPTAFLSDLPPLRLSRRFTLNREGEEGHLNQFAAALVEHGFSTASPERSLNPSLATTVTAAAAVSPRTNTSGVATSDNSDTAMLQGEAPRPAGEGSATTAPPRGGLADTATPTAARQGNASTSSDDSATARRLALRRTASAPALPTAAGSAKSTSAGNSSFRRMLAAWGGLRSGQAQKPAATAAGAAAGIPEQQQQQQQQSSPSLTGSRRRSSDASTPPVPNPPPREPSTSQVRFALDGSVNGTGDDDARERRVGASTHATATPTLPPRPRPSFRIDQATGNVVVAALPEHR